MTHKELLESLDKLLAESEKLAEARVDRRPFKRASKIGPGPRGGWKEGPTHQKRGYWKCKCKSYKCNCTGGKGEKKKVGLEPRWKSAYNAQYKAWHRKRLQKAAPGHFLGWNKADKAKKSAKRLKLQKLAKKRRIYK